MESKTHSILVDNLALFDDVDDHWSIGDMRITLLQAEIAAGNNFTTLSAHMQIFHGK